MRESGIFILRSAVYGSFAISFGEKMAQTKLAGHTPLKKIALTN